MGNSFQRYAVIDEGLGYFGDTNRIYHSYLASSSYRKQEEYLKNAASYKVLISPTISALTDYDIFLLEQQRKARHYMRMDAMGRINPVIGTFQFGSSLISDPIISGYSSYNNFSAGNYTEGMFEAGITFLSIAPVTKGIGKVAGKGGSNLALGLSDDLFRFAETKGFDTYKSFSTGFQKDKILNAMNSYDNIHFNITDFGKYKFSKFDPNAPLTYRNYTNWEMHTIFSNPNLLNKTTFYRNIGNGYEIVPNYSPFLNNTK